MSETVGGMIYRFNKNVLVDDDTQCWNWIGYKDKNGYGRFSIVNRPWLAHRVAYYFRYRELPSYPFHVLHKCNNRKCVNPEHLYIGTDKDNKRDQIEKDGVRSGGQKKKLSPMDIAHVFEQYAEGKTQKQIAIQFKVSQWNIWNILNNTIQG